MLFISFLGGILFYEFGSLLREPFPLYLILYVSGCGMVLLGLAILSYKQQFRDNAVAVAPEAEESETLGKGVRQNLTIALYVYTYR